MRRGNLSTDPFSEREFEVLRTLEVNPKLSQRQLAKTIGVSVGSINFCLKALVEKGFIKIGNFASNPKKSGYFYLLTPAGVQEKSKLTMAFLVKKQNEYVQLQSEIKQLQDELNERT
mgnify:CR=1 FL=1